MKRVRDAEGETLSPSSSLDGSFENPKSKYPRDREQEEEEEERRTLLTNEKFLEIIGVSLDNDTIPTETFYFPKPEKKEEEEEEKRIRVEGERQRWDLEEVVIKASDWEFNRGIPSCPRETFARIHYIWGKMASCEIDPKTSEIMKKAVDLAYATRDPRFISVYLNKSLIEASIKIEEGERKGLENTSICEAVIECFCISLLETAEYFLQYYSKKRLDRPVVLEELFMLEEIKQLNCFVRFYNELNREWVERPMILGAYSEYLQDEFMKTGVVEAWDSMSVDERIHHFKAFGMGFYQENEDPSCYYIIKDELIKLLERIVDDNLKDIFDKRAEQIRDKGFFGGKKTKNKSKRKSTNKKKSKRKSTNKKKSRKSRKSRK